MKILTGICTLLLLLSSCGNRLKTVDSSPIIISDGSIVIRHAKRFRDHFQDNHPKKDETIKAANYQPIALGYQCDPSGKPENTPCPSTPCNPAASAPCRIDISATSWDLSLCELAGNCLVPTVRLTWSNGAKDTIAIHSYQNDFEYTSSNPFNLFAGAKLRHPSANHLQAATFVMNGGTPFVFTCPSRDCLTIAFDK
jgi:hypothetical protein